MEKNNNHRTPQFHSSYQARKKKKKKAFKPVLFGVFILAVLAAAVVFVAPRNGTAASNPETAPEVVTDVVVEATDTKNLTAISPLHPNGIPPAGTGTKKVVTSADRQPQIKRSEIPGTPENIRKTLGEKYSWSMTVVNPEQESESFPLSNLIGADLDRLAKEIHEGSGTQYQVKFTVDEDLLQTDFRVMEYLWNVAPQNSKIKGYSAETDTFSLTDPEPGLAIDTEQLKKDILAAVEAGDFSREIPVTTKVVQAEIGPEEAKALYKTMGIYITHSTSNSDRNTNLRLACQSINGTYLEPGETFSFNQKTGERTTAKGYKLAAAYNNGVTVQEPGGGVCQVATTLYNAAIRAGLKITERHPHTYEPSYVTPGEDATVSFGGPDFQFTNNSKSAIVIRASYADQEICCSILGIPILEEGTEISLHSTKVHSGTIPVTYRDDASLPVGEQKVSSAGTAGSTWDTYKKVVRNGEVVSDEKIQTSTYNGHASVILIGTGVPVVQEQSAENILYGPDGQPIGINPQESQPVGPGIFPGMTPVGPGSDTAGGPVRETPQNVFPDDGTHLPPVAEEN